MTIWPAQIANSLVEHFALHGTAWHPFLGMFVPVAWFAITCGPFIGLLVWHLERKEARRAQ
jgi:hypothetical protein